MIPYGAVALADLARRAFDALIQVKQYLQPLGPTQRFSPEYGCPFGQFGFPALLAPLNLAPL